MINQTEALSKSETTTLLALVREHDLPIEQLACHMTRQQGHGRGKGPEGSFTPVFNISYNLMLCEYCGNLEPQEPACPAKLRVLKERLQLAEDTNMQTHGLLGFNAACCWKCHTRNAVRADLVQFDCLKCGSTNYARNGKWE